ncbi:MAG: hypothetical protein GXO39_06090 [Thermotogae bacterium]|nr:hypothetical protein [Thermotogota bacterium]
MLLFLAISEDSLVEAFKRRFVERYDLYRDYEVARYNVTRGYLLPRPYVFWDEYHLLPVTTFRYQYVDTIHLRLEEREIEIGLPNVQRLGLGIVWNPLDLQVLAGNVASEMAKRHALNTLQTAWENTIINFRKLIRMYVLLSRALTVTDTLLEESNRLISSADTLKRLGRIPESRYLEVRMKILKLKALRKELEGELEEVRDTLEILSGLKIENVSVGNDRLRCKSYDSTYLWRAALWRRRAESLWWAPRALFFAEVWRGKPTGMVDTLGFGSVYGIRITVQFDETGRLRSKVRDLEVKLLFKSGEREEGGSEFGGEEDEVEEARRIYEEALKMYKMGRLNIYELYRFKYEYELLKLNRIRKEVERLRKPCPVLGLSSPHDF